GDVRHRDSRRKAQHREVVFGMTLVELLAERLSYPRVGRHENAGVRAVDAVEPASLAARDVPGLGQLGRVLTEVPDVAVDVLRVPVLRSFGEMSHRIEAVIDLGANDAVDRLRPGRDGEDVATGLP